MFRWVVAAVVLGVLWTHWRAAHTAAVRAALADLPASAERFADLFDDLRDPRLAHRCRAVLADHRAGDAALAAEHTTAALERLDHLERFAPLRRLIQRH